MTPHDLAAAHCAAVPAESLAALADLRREPGVTVTVSGGRAWVRWGPGSGPVLRRLLPLSGVEFYARRAGLWYRPGCRLPAFGLPVDDGVEGAEPVPLARALTPLPARPVPPDGPPPRPVRLKLVRDDRPRPSAALRCGLDALGRWAETATTARVVAVQAALAGDLVLLSGRPLPPVDGAERFWGGRVLTPLGFRPEPDLPEPALLGALGAGYDELLVLSADGVEPVPLGAFRPLTRAGVRLALGGRAS